MLPSGLRLILEEARGTGHVEVVTYISAGSARDPEGRAGLAHLVEHVAMVRSRAHGRTRQELLEALGTRCKAGTGVDIVTYSAVAARASLAPLLAIESEGLIHPLQDLDVRSVELEKSVIMAERESTAELGEIRVGLRASLFEPTDPHSRTTIGSPTSLGAITIADLRDFATKNYRPENATLLVIGDFDVRAVRAEVLEALPGLLKARGAPRVVVPVVTQPSRLSPNGPLPEIRVAGSSELLLVAWMIPGGPRNSWLADHFRDRVAEATGKEVTSTGDGDQSVVVMTVPLKPGSTAEAQFQAIAATVEKALASQEIPRPQLFRQGALAIADDWIARGDRRALVAHTTGNAQLFEPLTGEEALQGELEAGALVWMTAARARGLVVHSAPIEPDASPLTPPLGVGPPPLSVPLDRVAAEASVPNLSGIRSTRLPSGLQVVVVPRPGGAQASVTVARPYGVMSGARGVAMLLAASSDRHSKAWARHEAAFGAGENAESFTGESVDLARLLDLAAQTTITAVAKAEVKVARAKLRAVMRAPAADGFLPAGYKDFFPSVAEFEAITFDDLERFREAGSDPSQSAVVIVGDIEPENALRQATVAFNGWARSELPALTVEPAVTLLPREPIVRLHPTDAQAFVAVKLTCWAEAAAAPNHASSIAAQILSQRFGQLRTQFGGVYEVSGGLTLTPQANTVEETFRIQPRLLKPALRYLIQGLSSEAEPAELDRARWAVASRIRAAQSLDGNQIGFWLAISLSRGASLESLPQTNARVATVPSDDVRRALRQCAGTQVWDLVGPESELLNAKRILGEQMAASP